MATVTYLFGAGASCHCLPIGIEITERMEAFKRELEQRRQNVIVPTKRLDEHFKYDPIESNGILLSELNDLIRMSRKRASIDTYAKKLIITNNNYKYSQLKILLSLFFVYEQRADRVDPRYDSFFASILGKTAKALDNRIRILSWNYDFQFEKAYAQYSNETGLQDNQSDLNVYSKQIKFQNINTDKFAIFKLNGTTAFRDTNSDNLIEIFGSFENISTEEHFNKLVEAYAICIQEKSPLNPTLSFAWEIDEVKTNSFLEKIRESIKESEALVVIGYSFPFFNRQIDRHLLSKFAGERIFIQDINPNRIERSMRSVIDFGTGRGFIEHFTIPEKSTEQFILPSAL